MTNFSKVSLTIIKALEKFWTYKKDLMFPQGKNQQITSNKSQAPKTKSQIISKYQVSNVQNYIVQWVLVIFLF